MTEPEPFNPYRPPEVQEHPDTPFGEDSEFLISEAEILCRETVNLPGVCIHTGTSEDLLPRQATFQSFSIPFRAVAAILLVALSMSAGSVAAPFELLILAAVLLVGMSLIPGLSRRLLFGLPGVTKVTASWYVNREYAHRCRRRKRIAQAAIVVVMFLGGFAVALGSLQGTRNSVVHAGLWALCSAVFFGLLSLTLRTERKLSYSGWRRRGAYKDLFSLTGHSRQFTETVERIIHGGF